MAPLRVCDSGHANDTMSESPISSTVCRAAKIPYRGRFAPTPSGPLHLGSLLTALASWLTARAVRGTWLLRIDDLDRERCDPGTSALILRQLERHGLHWDETPRYQSQHIDSYLAALARLDARGAIYGCDCSRAQLRDRCRSGSEGPVYDGHCRHRRLDLAGNAWRLLADGPALSFDDGRLGRQRCDITGEIGDFVVRRRDGTPAYQLACVVDEQAQGITEVVRGADLLASTFMQLQLARSLGIETPAYRHLPVVMSGDGRKLSKQNHAPSIDEQPAAQNLWQCLGWLGHTPPVALQTAAIDELLGWALCEWQPERLPTHASIEVERPR
jgi:glutamyl-Q tRNA(Asp) synthetase